MISPKESVDGVEAEVVSVDLEQISDSLVKIEDLFGAVRQEGPFAYKHVQIN